MKKYTFPLAFLALAATTLSAPLAHAASASSALSNVYIQLFDLDPLDGITPALTFSNGDSSLYGYAFDGVGLNYNDVGPMGSALANSVTDGGAQAASAVLAGNVWLPASGNGANSSAAAVGLNANAYGQGQLINSQFTVTAKTVVVMTATGQASAAAALGESAYASAYVGMQDLTSNNYSYGQAYSQVDVNGNAYGSGGPLTVQASFVNLLAGNLIGNIYAVAYSSASGVTPVPEPTSYALMLAGVLALGFVSQRRRQH